MNDYGNTVESLSLVQDSRYLVHAARRDGHTVCGLNASDVRGTKDVGLPRHHRWCVICQDVYNNRSLILTK